MLISSFTHLRCLRTNFFEEKFAEEGIEEAVKEIAKQLIDNRLKTNSPNWDELVFFIDTENLYFFLPNLELDSTIPTRGEGIYGRSSLITTSWYLENCVVDREQDTVVFTTESTSGHCSTSL